MSSVTSAGVLGQADRHRATPAPTCADLQGGAEDVEQPAPRVVAGKGAVAITGSTSSAKRRSMTAATSSSRLAKCRSRVAGPTPRLVGDLVEGEVRAMLAERLLRRGQDAVLVAPGIGPQRPGFGLRRQASARTQYLRVNSQICR